MPTQLPVTFQQLWLWNLIQQYKDWRCILTYVLRLSGAMDVDSLQTSLDEVIRRHVALRTRIFPVDGTPVQEISEPTTHRLSVAPVAGATRAEIDANLRRALEEFSDRGIDPTSAPLLSFGLFRVGEHEHFLVLTIHRLITDCISVDLVFREIWQLYEKFAQGGPGPAPAAAQYNDYTTWQQQSYPEWLQRHERFWSERLAGVSPMRWPVSRGTAGAERGAIGRMKCLFGPQLSGELREAARRAQTLSAMFMLTIYVAVLVRWCKQKDLVVPFNVAGRQSEHKYVIGYFSHILYLRLKLTGSETFQQLLGAVSNEFYRALSHQDYGTMATKQPGLLEGTFFQWISWHKTDVAGKAPPEEVKPDALTAERFSFREFGEGLTAIPPGLVDVEVTFFDTDEGIYALGVYRADRFSGDAMEEFIQELRSAAKEFVQNRDALVAAGELELGTALSHITAVATAHREAVAESVK